MADVYGNFAYCALSSGISASTTVLPVDSTSRVPDPTTGDVWLTIDSTLAAGQFEIIKVVSKTSNSLTVLRAQEGTLAQAATPVGTYLRGSITTAMLDRLRYPTSPDGTSWALTIDNFGKLTTTPRPTNYLFYDNFNQPDGPLSSHWTQASGSAAVVTSVARCTTAGNAGALAYVSDGSINVADMSIDVLIPTLTTYDQNVLGRYQDGAHFYNFLFSNNGTTLFYKNAGAGYVSLGSGPSVSSGDRFRCTVKGTTLTLTNLTKGTTASVTDTSIVGAGTAGLRWSDNTGSFDDFVVRAA